MVFVVRLLADGLMLPIVAIAGYSLLWCTPDRRRYDTYTYILMAGITSYTLAKFAGALWQPELRRPFEELGVSAGAAYLNNPGFPSDHTLFAGFLTFAVWYATRSTLLTIAMAALSILVAVGRVAALVHTPLDVVGGFVFACLGASWYLLHAARAKNNYANN
jgi:membrane-associated phospholipid phosphatase